MPVLAPFGGIVIGITHLPLVNEGEALLHVARFDAMGTVSNVVEEFQQELDISLGYARESFPVEDDQKPEA